MLDGCLALVLLSPMMCQIVWAGTGAGGGCWRSGSGPQRSRFMLHLWLPNWCNEACLLGSPPSSQQLAKAYMDGGGNSSVAPTVGGRATSCFTSRKLREPAEPANMCGPHLRY